MASRRRPDEAVHGPLLQAIAPLEARASTGDGSTCSNSFLASPASATRVELSEWTGEHESWKLR